MSSTASLLNDNWVDSFFPDLRCTPVKVIPAASLQSCLVLLQMPKGVPVATVAIGNAANAGLLALRILAASDAALQQKMLDYQVR